MRDCVWQTMESVAVPTAKGRRLSALPAEQADGEGDAVEEEDGRFGIADRSGGDLQSGDGTAVGKDGDGAEGVGLGHACDEVLAFDAGEFG